MTAVPEEEAEPGEASNTKYAAQSKGESRIKSTKIDTLRSCFTNRSNMVIETDT
jgi:hypothetical protein